MPTTTRYVIVKAKRLPGRPRWLVVAAWTVVALAACAGLTAGVAAAWLQRTTGQVARNNPPEVAAVRPQLAHSRPGKPVNILVLGSDRRAGDLSLGARSDTLMVVRLDPQTGSISMLSVPRDLRVEIPGYGLTKINAAYAYGGAALSLRVTKRLLGIPINDFVDIDFDGFKQVVNKLGGAYLMIDRRYYNDTAVTDYASINIQPGYQRLSGAAALSWVRFRHDQSGDFTRIVRQEIFLREMKRQLMTSARLSSLPRFLAVMGIVSHNVTSDISSLGKSYGLLKLALRLDNARVYQTHVYGSAPMIDGIDYVVATRGQVRAAVRRLLHPQWATPRTAAAGVKAGAATTASTPTSAASPSASPSTAASGSKPVVTDSLRHVAEWRALQRRCGLPLSLPASLPAGAGYDEFRSYTVSTPSGAVKAAVVVGTTPQGGSWDVQAIAWPAAPILASPDSTATVGGRLCSLYYDGARLRMVAWRSAGVAYWVSNTLDEQLSNTTMLALAASCVPVP